MPIEPVDPSKRTGGDGNEKYTPEEKRGPGKFDKALEDAKKRFSEIAEEGRKQGDIRKQYSDTGPRTGTNISGTFGSTGIPKTNRDLMKNNKAGGIIKSASKRADGCCIRGKTRA